MTTPHDQWMNAVKWALAAGQTLEEAIKSADRVEENRIVLQEAAHVRFDAYGQRRKSRSDPPNLFDSLEDADAHDYEVGAEIGVRSHSEGVLIYKLMQAGNGEPFWRLTMP